MTGKAWLKVGLQITGLIVAWEVLEGVFGKDGGRTAAIAISVVGGVWCIEQLFERLQERIRSLEARVDELSSRVPPADSGL